MAMFSLFVIGGALKETGVAAWLGDHLVRLARGNEAALIGLVMG